MAPEMLKLVKVYATSKPGDEIGLACPGDDRLSSGL